MTERTQIIIPSQSIANVIEGLWSVDQIKTMYAAQITGLSAMTGSAVDNTTAEGVTRVITFNPQTGNKG